LAKLLVEYPEYQVIVIGQSRGAPLAIFTSMELISSLNCPKERIETWMYGSPRFASSGLVKRIKQMNLKLYNVHYDGDPVTHLPPYGLGFYHIPPVVYVVDKELDPQTGKVISKGKRPRNTYICDPDEGEDPRCSFSTSLLDMVNGPHHQRYRDWEIFGEQLAFSPPKTCVEK
ncbi:Alpha/Beta hydrolase protein, partial [Paraphysoderma sedebokerense]